MKDVYNKITEGVIAVENVVQLMDDVQLTDESENVDQDVAEILEATDQFVERPGKRNVKSTAKPKTKVLATKKK